MKSWFILAGGLLFLPASGIAAEVTLQNAFPNLLPPFNYPTNLQDPRDGTDRLFVLEQEGKVWVFQNDPAVNTRTLFLDLTAKVNNTWECGLVGLAFHPDYENNGEFFVYYMTSGAQLKSRLSRFHVGVDANHADPNSEEILYEIPQTNFCHKSGCLVFGEDGYLYITVGDDCQGWPGQDRTSLMGKLLRIDVDNTSPGLAYAIPPDNPFVGNPFGWRQEIWAYGFRNPWRFSIDSETQRIWLGDVGEATWEEANLIKKGRNYGWMKMEGTNCFPNVSSCDTLGMNAVLPIWQFPHVSEMGESVTGGYVYRGHTCPSLWGKYVYADYVNGVIWALSYNGVSATNDEIYNQPPSKYLSTFGTDKDDEVYVVSLYGYIYRMIDITTDVDGSAPPATSLEAYPNPFQTATHFAFDVPASEDARVEIFDVSGHRVRVLPAQASAASRTVTWNGTDDRGHELASGVYFARLLVRGSAAGYRRVILVR